MRRSLAVLAGSATLVGVTVFGLSGTAHAAETLAPEFASDYSMFDLGTPAGVPGPLGGIVVKRGDPSKILVGGSANQGGGAIYEVPVTRDGNGHVTAFAGPGTLFSTAPNIDGGLAYAPNGVLLYTAYSSHLIGEIKPGSTVPDKIVTAPGPASVGTLAFVPTDFPNAGAFKVASYSGGTMYTSSLTPDGSGTFDIGAPTDSVSIGGGPEGIAYVPPGSPGFPSRSVLISHYSSGAVRAYEVDANANPVPGSARDFITGLGGVEGAVIDEGPNDFLFSTFNGGNRVIVVRGFVPPKQCGTGGSRVSVGDASVVEGNSGKNRKIQFKVTLNQPADHEVDVNYIVNAGSATYPGDIASKIGMTKTIKFKPSATTGLTATTKAVTVQIAPDTTAESNENFSVVLSSPTGGYTIGRGTGTGTIIDDEGQGGGQFASIATASACEGDAATAKVTLQVTLAQPAAVDTLVNATVSDGTATGGKVPPADFKAAAKPLKLTFKTGQVQKAVNVTIFADGAEELDETVAVALSSSAVTLNPTATTTVATILDDDLGVDS